MKTEKGETPSGVAPTIRVNAARETPSEPTLVDVSRIPTAQEGFEHRYELCASLGSGGMGEVRRYHDRRIGRDVALKMLHRDEGSRSDARVRFEREVRIQGQLEHPSIVPVYDVGWSADGTAFFTMKRLSGMTLAELIAQLGDEARAEPRSYSRRRLLTQFDQVVLAVAYAHRRGVVHRDLKPENVMFGDFGEVYVLDWGLAKVLGASELSGRAQLSAPAGGEEAAPLDADDAATQAGEIMGTPGYMAPEQARGEQAAVDARTDVYALGAILFELLTFAPLHPRGSLADVIASTLASEPRRPSQERPELDIPPELDALCLRATAREPTDRFESALELHVALERFLDGERDQEQRRRLAAVHVEDATRAIAGDRPSLAPADRVRALRELGAALTLDPQNQHALAGLVAVLTSAPRRVPAELAPAFERDREHVDLAKRRISPIGYAVWALVTATVATLGIRSGVAFALALGSQSVTALAAALALRVRSSERASVGVFTLSTLAVIASATWLGSMIVLPGVVALNTMGYVLLAHRGAQKPVIAMGTAGLLVPFVLQHFAWMPPSYAFEQGRLVILPVMTELPPRATSLFLLLSNLLLVLLPALLFAWVRDRLDAAEERSFMQLWYLKHLLPEKARSDFSDDAG